MIVLVAILGLIAVVVGIALLMAWPFMWGWNYAVVSAISVANPIDYWVAFVLMLFIGFFIQSQNSSSK